MGESYRAINSKFIYSFIDDEEPKNTKSTKKNNNNLSVGSVGGSNFLSITKMTDDAISHRSRNNSEAKSDRSYADDDDEDNSYV